MALIKRTDLHGMVYDPVPMDMEDVRLRAQQMRDEAEAYAERVVLEAQAERERLIDGAEKIGHERGYQEGYAEGLEKGKADGAEQALKRRGAKLGQLETAWTEALAAFDAARDDMLDRARNDMLVLACAIARKVVGRMVELDGTMVVEQLRSVLRAHARPTSLFVRVHPADELLARQALPELMATLTGGDHVELEADERVSRGSCAALTEGAGVIDADLDRQLDRIVRELIPEDDGQDQRESDSDEAPDGHDTIGDAA